MLTADTTDSSGKMSQIALWKFFKKTRRKFAGGPSRTREEIC